MSQGNKIKADKEKVKEFRASIRTGIGMVEVILGLKKNLPMGVMVNIWFIDGL